jgi:FixH
MNTPSEHHTANGTVPVSMNVERPKPPRQPKPSTWQRWKSERWAMMPFALLGGLGAGLAVIIRIAVNDPSFAVEPEYYQHALKWDEERARQEQSARLGWTVVWDFAGPASGSAGPSLTPSQSSVRPLKLQLRDALGQPITGARIDVSAFHKARAANVQRIALREGDAGVYAAELRLDRSGIWRVRMDVAARNEHFALSQDLELTLQAGRVLGLSGGTR